MSERLGKSLQSSEQQEIRIQTHNVIELGESEFVDAIQKDFGLAITDVEKVPVGFSSQVFRARVEGESVFIRINRDPDVFPVEVKGYEIFEDQGIPVPQVVAYQPNPATLGYPTLILSAAKGEELSRVLSRVTLAPEVEQVVYEEMGHILARIHETKIEGFGRLRVDGEKLLGEYDKWTSYQERLGRRVATDIDFLEQRHLLEENELSSIRDAQKKISELLIHEAHLLHHDMQAPHVFVEGEKITGIIDLGDLQAGDPRDDIATSLVFQTPKQQEAFKKGYGALAQDPMVDAFQLIIAARKIVFRSKNAPEHVEKIIRTFKEIHARMQSQV